MDTYVREGIVKLVFSPVLNHGIQSSLTHQAAECAGDQGQFWEFREVLFDKQSTVWSKPLEKVKGLAEDFGLDTAEFNACMDQEKYLDSIEAQDKIAKDRGIFSQPVFDINGEVLAGSQKFETFQAVIDEALQQ